MMAITNFVCKSALILAVANSTFDVAVMAQAATGPARLWLIAVTLAHVILAVTVAKSEVIWR